MIPLHQHPLYTEVLAALPEGNYADICVPEMQTFNPSRLSQDTLRLASILGVSREEAVEKFGAKYQRDVKIELLNHVGTGIYYQLFDNDAEEPTIFDAVQLLDKHLYMAHDFPTRHTEQELWSNAFAYHYGLKLGWFDASIKFPVVKSEREQAKYMRMVREIVPDIESNDRQVANRIHRQLVDSYEHKCGVADDYLNMSEQEFVDELDMQHEDSHNEVSDMIEDMLYKVFGRSAVVRIDA